MFRIKAILWTYLLSWACSALLHSTDAEFGGISGFWSPSAILSVSLLGVILFIPALFCQIAFTRKQKLGFIIAVSSFATGLGLIISVLGYGGASVSSWILSFVGSSILFGLFLVFAALPTLRLKGA